MLIMKKKLKVMFFERLCGPIWARMRPPNQKTPPLQVGLNKNLTYPPYLPKVLLNSNHPVTQDWIRTLKTLQSY